jgi:hypothetical protein
VRSGGKPGFVPTTYVEILAPAISVGTPAVQASRPASTYSNSGSSIANSLKKKGPAVAPKRGAKVLKYVEALFAYEAQSEEEHGMEVGDRFVLVKPDPGDGWVEVERGGKTASVPASYVQSV